jgi:hypothetical protein
MTMKLTGCFIITPAVHSQAIFAQGQENKLTSIEHKNLRKN